VRFIQSSLILLLIMAIALPVIAQPDPVRAPVPAGWTAVDEEYRYHRDTLWEYINGAAELFLSYGFRELVVLDMEQGDSGLSVSVYDMSRPLDAFGIYERERPGSGDELAGVGAAAILQPPYRGLFLKDRFYVKVEVGGDDVTAEQLTQAMRDIADALPGDNELPDQLTALPEPNRVPGSVAFTGSSYLGLGDLNNCLHAEYRQEDGPAYELFVMTPSTAFLKDMDRKWSRENCKAAELMIWREIPYKGVVMMRGDETQLLGVSGFAEREATHTFLHSLDETE